MKAHGRKRNRSRQGAALLSVVIALILVSILGASMAGLLHRTGNTQSLPHDLARARYLAESGINFALRAGQFETLASNAVSVTVAFDARDQFTVTVTESNQLYRVESLGTTGIGTGRETRQRITRSGIGYPRWDPDASAPPVEITSAGPPIDEDFSGGGQVSWKVSGQRKFTQIRDPSGGNWLLADVSGQDMSEDVEQAGHYIANEFLPLEEQWRLDPAWKANDRQISYDVQVKMVWDYDRWYGLQGLSMGHVNNDQQTRSYRAMGYQVSLMRYATEGETGRYQETFDYSYDGIPNTIKPPGLAGHRLLVVWIQYGAGNKREWIAYKDLDNYAGLPGEAAVDWVMDWNDGQSGRCFKDYATIGARMIEARANGIKYRYLQVFRADPKTGVARAGNAVGNDINENRAAYLAKAYGGTFPQWWPLDFSEWSATDDVFTFVGTSSSDPLEMVTWDGINYNVISDLVLMPDQGTLRLDYKALTTSEDPTVDWSPKEFEIALNVTGNFNETMINRMYFDEFGVRFLKIITSDDMVPGVQY